MHASDLFKTAFLVAGLSAPALAQNADPAQAVMQEWESVAASDRVAISSHAHFAEVAGKLVQAYQQLQKENAALESRLATAMEWLKRAQETVPAR